MKTFILYLAAFLLGALLTLGVRECVMSEVKRANDIEQEFKGIRLWVGRLEQQQASIRTLVLMEQTKKGRK